MSKKTVFSRPLADESHQRNAFDRSFQCNVNFSGGMLIPTFCQFVFGHSHCRINQRSFFRTSDVNRPAFPSLPMYTDFYYVPMHQLLSNWNAFRSRTQDRSSSLIGIPTRLPAITDALVKTMINTQAAGGSVYNDAAGYNRHFGSIRLLDLLQYSHNRDNVYYDSGAGEYVKNAIGDCNPLKLCAYQKIYYDHYRNTAYERNDVSAYNLDRFYPTANIGNNDSVAPTSLSYQDLDVFCTLRYVNYRRDLFQTIYPSLNFNAFGSGFNLQQLNSLPANFVNVFVNSNGQTSSNWSPSFDDNSVNLGTAFINNNSNSVSRPVSTSILRASFALEKLLRVSAFTPQHVKDQFKARFGYTPKSANLQESVRLGSFKNDIIIGEVTSMAANAYANLGSVGGKGVGAGDYEKTINFDVPEDGIIMGVSYVLPLQTYDSNFVDPINQQFVPEDWSLPEYENLGLQPIFNKNVSVYRNTGSDTDAAQLARGNMILGYQPRDIQYKASVSVNHGMFNYTQQLSPFVLHGNIDYLNSIGSTGTTGVSYTYFKCKPQDFGSIFVQHQNSGDEYYDQFFGNIVNQFACIQDKPIFGIPKL